jgi:hypothetical protein
MRRGKKSRTNVCYSKSSAIVDSNCFIVLKWSLNLKIFQVMSDMCFCSTISIPSWSSRT